MGHYDQYKWSDIVAPYKRFYKWITGAKTPLPAISTVITPLLGVEITPGTYSFSAIYRVPLYNDRLRRPSDHHRRGLP